MTIKLKLGDSGQEVYQLQQMLNRVLPGTINPDGDFGGITEAAVKEYQSMKFNTGYVSDYLWDLLEKDYAEEARVEELREGALDTSGGLPDELLLKSFSGGDLASGNFLWTPTENKSDRKGVPIDTIVIHYTVSASIQGTISWFKKTNHNAVSSSHFIVDYDGSVVKMVNIEDCAWHAGGTTMQDGTKNVNRRSIGIEIENWGKLRKDGNKLKHPWAEIEYDRDLHGSPYQDKEGNLWMPYTKEQVASTKEICAVMAKKYDIKWIVGHEEIAQYPDGRKWKFDPGPAFPMKDLKEILKA